MLICYQAGIKSINAISTDIAYTIDLDKFKYLLSALKTGKQCRNGVYNNLLSFTKEIGSTLNIEMIAIVVTVLFSENLAIY